MRVVLLLTPIAFIHAAAFSVELGVLVQLPQRIFNEQPTPETSTVVIRFRDIDSQKIDLCTGVLIGRSQVITAAHCLFHGPGKILSQPENVHVLFNETGSPQKAVSGA